MIRIRRPSIARNRIMDRRFFNVLQSAAAFFCIFAAFNSQGFIQELALNSFSKSSNNSIDENSGYNSQSIIYGVFTFSNFIAPPICNLFGGKWAMVVGSICYLFFLASFLYLVQWLLYLASAVVGFGAAVLWTGQAQYMTLNSNQDTIGRNSGLFWAFLQSSLLVGGAFLYFMFSGKSAADESFDPATIRTLYGVFSVACCAGVVVLLFLGKPPKSEKKDHQKIMTASLASASASEAEALISDESPRSPIGVSAPANEYTDSVSVTNDDIVDSVVQQQYPSSRIMNWRDMFRQWLQQMIQTFRLMLTRNMLLLIVVFFYSGVETSFWLGVYPACLGFTTAFNLSGSTEIIVAYNALFAGVGQIVGGGSFGIFGHRTNKYGRNPIIILGCVLHFVAFFFVFLNIPNEAPLGKTSDVAYMRPSVYLALTCSVLLGFSDACWNTQIYSLLGSLYPGEDSAQAFALFKAWQSAASCMMFFLASKMTLNVQLIIMGTLNFFACILYFPVEWDAQSRPTSLKMA